MQLTTEQITAALEKRLADPEAAAKIGDKEAVDNVRQQFHDRLNSLSGSDLGTLLAAKGIVIEGVNDQPNAPTVNLDAMRQAGIDIDKVDAVYEDAMDAPLPKVEDIPVAEYPPKPPTAPYSTQAPAAGPKHAAPDDLEYARKRIAELEAQVANRPPALTQEESDELAIAEYNSAEWDGKTRLAVPEDRKAFVAKAKADLEAEEERKTMAAGDAARAYFDAHPDVELAYDNVELADVEGESDSAATEAGDPETWTEPGEAYPGQNLDDETDAEIAAVLGAAAGEKYAAAVEDFDPVKRPMHYNSHPSGVECNTIARHYSFNIGSAIKYLWRHGLKSDAPAAQDLRKAIQFLEFELEKIEAAE